MEKVKNLSRYWVDKASNIIVRKWTSEEYMRLSPRQHIFEKYWSYYCPICNFIPNLCFDEIDAKHGANNHKHYCGHRHKCVVKYRNHELVCLEFKEEYLEEFDVWVAKQKLY